MDFSASTSSDDFLNLHPPPPGPVKLKVNIIFVLVVFCIKLKVLLDRCGCVIWYMMITSDNFACQLSLHNHHHQTYCQARLLLISAQISKFHSRSRKLFGFFSTNIKIEVLVFVKSNLFKYLIFHISQIQIITNTSNILRYNNE